MAGQPGRVEKAFNNMDLFAEDHLVSSMRPDLKNGVLEAKQIFEGEIIRLIEENRALELELGEFASEESSGLAVTSPTPLVTNDQQGARAVYERKHPRVIPVGSLETTCVGGEPTCSRRQNSGKRELLKPQGPFPIPRPYPVYVICYKCDQRVLTKVTPEEESSGSCCPCFADPVPKTVIHSCPLCGTYLGIFRKTIY